MQPTVDECLVSENENAIILVKKHLGIEMFSTHAHGTWKLHWLFFFFKFFQFFIRIYFNSSSWEKNYLKIKFISIL